MNSVVALDDERQRHPSSLASARVTFAHPSERLFATLLDLYGVEWEYEPYEFPLAWNERNEITKAFRPDFLLPRQNLFVEITVAEQRLVTKKNAKIRAFRELYPEVTLVVAYQRDIVALLNRHGLGPLNDSAA